MVRLSNVFILTVMSTLIAVFPVAGADAASPSPHPTPTGGAGAAHQAPAVPPASAMPQFKGLSHRRTCASPSAGHASCFAEVVDGIAHPSLSSGSVPPGFGPSDLRSAYALPASGGSGATIAIVDAFDLTDAESELATYRSQFGLPACTSANGCFRKVDQRGGTSFPRSDPGWGPETAIDIEMASAACPQCNILLVEADDSTVSNLAASVDTAVLFGARYVSNSYGSSDGADYSAYQGSYDHSGVAITAASGDGGYGAQFPATAQHVTAVGGTTLSPSSATPRGWAESAWSGAGSGCSASTPKPAWQTDTGCSTKTTADISAVADPSTGVAGYGPTTTAPYTPAWQVFGGTSVSSPLIAGMYALAGVPTAGSYPAQYPYLHPGALNDVTTGANATSCSPSYLCTAGPGYDGPTGLGTPNGIAALTASSAQPAPLVQGDFNSDGTADVLARTSGGALDLYRGDGHGGWKSPASVQVGSGWGGMTAILSPGDFDGDGHNDVMARDSAGNLWLYPGDGSSGWGPRRQVGSGWGSMTAIVAAHDFNRDGTADVVAVDGSGALWLYPGDGHGGWLARQAIGSGWSGLTVLGIRDFAGDGNPGLLARDASGRLILYDRTASGWKAPVVVGTGWNSMTAIVSVGDFNGDGIDDVLGRTTAGDLILYPGNGHSGWGTAVQVGSGWNSMTWIG